MPGAILRYKKRLSGPLLDRIDLHIDVPPVEEDKLISSNLSESSETVRIRITRAREIQKRRFFHHRIKTNGEMNNKNIKELCRLTPEATNLLKQALYKLSISARSYFKIIKVSQTIADLAGENIIESNHIAEALQFRTHDD